MQMFRLFVVLLIMLRAAALRVSVFARPTWARAASTAETGVLGTPEFRVFFTEKGNKISPWHDIPLRSGEYFNFVCEIPKFSRAKMEIATKEPHNPIAQDKKNGQLRDYPGPIFWNYGALPQTWEDPHVTHPDVHCKGDNDPLDVVEIGSKALKTGSVTEVKVLGILALVDDGELDWKVLAVRTQDELASRFNDISDLERHHPEILTGIREWFRWYKTPDGKPLNRFGFDEKILPRKVALEVIEETHHYWKDLRSGKTDRGQLWVKE